MHPDQFRSHPVDPDLAGIMSERRSENEDGFTLIPSENHPHPDDVAAQRDAVDATFEGGYFEGYPPAPGKRFGSGRYYQGVKLADELEELTRRRVVAAFGKGLPRRGEELQANVQVPTGAGANLSVYLSVMKPGDTMVAPSLASGYGHLSHGADSPNAVGRLFNVVGYGIDPDTGLLDYDALERAVLEHRPKLVVGGGSAYPRDVDWRKIADIANQVGAVSMADISHPAGLVLAGLLNDPVADGIDVVTTTTHKTLRGLKGAVIVWNRTALNSKVPLGASTLAKPGIDFGVFPGIWGGPNMATIAGHASTFRRAQTPEFKEEQERTKRNAAALAQILKNYRWEVVTGGTDTHLVLVDVVRSEVKNDATSDGWQAAIALEDVGLVSNKNAVPGSNEIRKGDGSMTNASPIRPAGLRLGTPAVTARGMNVDDVQELGVLIHETLQSAGQARVLHRIRNKVRELAGRFPLPEYK